MLRESGFMLDAFEMERLYDWDLESWKNAILTILAPLTVLVGTIKPKTPSIQTTEPRTQTSLPPPRYASTDDSDSSVESPKRMPMRRTPRVMQLTAKSAEPEARAPEEAVPKALEEAIIRLTTSSNSTTEDVNEAPWLDFDEDLLPDDSWEPGHVAGEFEVEAIELL
ncbi:Eukaryotic/viral aspartic protease [Phytophthora megakarya]|uniref:Eukaryotic/viral aspartic protease n=1 Tax=Phytophthora megakarya TaxID=4795 RepID=A0A225WQC5_9STRA|nr:Eukaryotic/viral aspartic protease [Phytophthora megakarya]